MKNTVTLAKISDYVNNFVRVYYNTKLGKYTVKTMPTKTNPSKIIGYFQQVTLTDCSMVRTKEQFIKSGKPTKIHIDFVGKIIDKVEISNLKQINCYSEPTELLQDGYAVLGINFGKPEIFISSK